MKGHAFFYSFKTRVTLVLILAMVAVTGLNSFLVYRSNIVSHFEDLRNSLITIARTASLSINSNTIQKIPLTWDGVRSSAYREASEQLAKIREVHASIRYIYVLSKTKVPGKLRFLIDLDPKEVEPDRKRGTARPGDLYDASPFPEMLEGFEVPSADRKLQNDPWGVTLSGYAPIKDREGKTVAILGIDIPADDIYRMQQEIKKQVVLVLLAGLLVCGILGVLIAGTVSNPVRKLVEGTRQLAKDNLNYRVDVSSRDEIGELAESFNKMAASLAESRERLRNYFFKVTQSLVRALEAKDPYTQGHSERVAGLAYKTALELGASPEKAELIRCVAELHDIGKLVIHDSILNKKEKLNAEEWKVLQEHPVTGEKILKSILDEELLRVIRSHHERVDGKGYPDGLRGEAIDVSSQIVSIADSYDAMTSSRSYRGKALSHEDAILEIKRERGAQFLPEVVDAFLKVMQRPA